MSRNKGGREHRPDGKERQKMDIKQSIISWAQAHEREYLEDLKELIAIDSARGEAKPGMPYGEGCAAALAKAQ